jgi:hypothetical protein
MLLVLLVSVAVDVIAEKDGPVLLKSISLGLEVAHSFEEVVALVF